MPRLPDSIAPSLYVETRPCARPLTTHPSFRPRPPPRPSVALTKDGTRLVFSSNLGWIRLIETATGTEITTDGWPVAPRKRANDTNPEREYDPIIFSSPVVDARGYVFIAAEVIQP